MQSATSHQTRTIRYRAVERLAAPPTRPPPPPAIVLCPAIISFRAVANLISSPLLDHKGQLLIRGFCFL